MNNWYKTQRKNYCDCLQGTTDCSVCFSCRYNPLFYGKLHCAGISNKWHKDRDIQKRIDISEDGFVTRKLVTWKIKRNINNITCAK